MKLIVLNGPQRGLVAPLDASPLVVGSDAAANVSLPDDPQVAAFHCRLQCDGGHCWVENLEGAGSTRVHGKRPSNRTLLVAGDIVTVGVTRLVVVEDGTDSAAILAEPPAGPVADEAREVLPSAAETRPAVLVVDDDIDILFYIQALLQHRGYDVVTALNGVEALIRIHEHTPDLIVCDIQMPRMDGFSLLKKIRQLPGLGLVPLIVLTALDFEDISRRSFPLGADDCVSKDRLKELEPRVAQALRRRTTIETTLRKPPETSEPGPAPGITGTLDQVPVTALLSFLQMERKTGVLVLHNAGVGETVRLSVRDGAIVAARLEGADAPRHADAVYLAILWMNGTFAFTASEVTEADEVGADMTELLIEAARRQDEAARQGEGADDEDAFGPTSSAL